MTQQHPRTNPAALNKCGKLSGAAQRPPHNNDGTSLWV